MILPSEIRLAVFDLDGTLLRGDTVCETLARPLGKLTRMRELENASTIEDVKVARAEIVSWYSGREMDDLRSYLTAARLAPGAVEGFKMLRDHGIKACIASLTWSFAVERFAEILGAAAWIGSEVNESGIVNHCWPSDKAHLVRNLALEHSLERKQLCAVGDSWGDIQMLSEVVLPIFVGKTLVAGLPDNVVHMPDADIRDVANAILAFPQGG